MTPNGGYIGKWPVLIGIAIVLAILVGGIWGLVAWIM